MTTTTQQKRFRNTAMIHREYSEDDLSTVYGQRVDATLTLEDGRTVQVGVLNNGRVILRAWPAEPYATNNADAIQVSFTLPTLEDMLLNSAQVSDLNMQAHPLTPRSLADPENRNGTWHLATQAIKQRVEGLRVLLALREPKPETD